MYALLAKAIEGVKIMKLNIIKPYFGIVALLIAVMLLALAVAGCFTSAPANSEPVTHTTFQTTASDYLKTCPHFTEVYDGSGMKVHMDGGGDGYGHRTLLFTYTFGGKDSQQHTAQIYVCGAIMDENYDLINGRYIK